MPEHAVHNSVMNEQPERHHGCKPKGVGEGYMVELGRAVAAVATAENCRGNADGVHARAPHSAHLWQSRGKVERDTAA